jgi:hypothetical protein
MLANALKGNKNRYQLNTLYLRYAIYFAAIMLISCK